MSGKTPIQWTDRTWNPVVGCTRVSAGCDHCYAFQLAWKRGRWPDAPQQYHHPFSHVQLLAARLDDPRHWRKPCRVFVNSVSDLFHPDVPDSFIASIFETMARCPRHTFQVLTKRPQRMAEFVERWIDDACWPESGCPITDGPLPNVWLGVSVENQAAADERIPPLLQTPAQVRFLSCEPLLGPVDLVGDAEAPGPIWQKRTVQIRTDYGSGTEWDVELESGVDWVIIGGESGKHARVMNPRWALALIEQCRTAGMAVFMKQLGSELAFYCGLKDKHGGDMEAWPPDFDKCRVREWPAPLTALSTIGSEVRQ